MSAMTLEQARNILAEVAEERIRWGKMYDIKKTGEARVLDAIVALAQHESQEVAELKKALSVSQKQLGMAKAREKGLRNRLEASGVDPDKVAPIENTVTREGTPHNPDDHGGTPHDD